MADKALISELSWRSLEMQKHAFPDLPHYLAPDELPSLLRQSQRKDVLNIHVMSHAVIADNEKDFRAFMESLPKGCMIFSREEPAVIGQSTPIKKAIAHWGAARKFGAAKVGGRISAENRKKRSAEAVARIKDRWCMDSKAWPTKVLLKEADISYNTAKTLLPPRPVAQFNYRTKHGKQIRQVELNPAPREKMDFCGVYIFQIEEGVYKVGSSNDSGRRFKQVSQHHKKQMKVVETFNMDITKAVKVEAQAHYLLRKCLAREYNGREIFKASLNTVRNAINKAIKNVSEAPKYE